MNNELLNRLKKNYKSRLQQFQPYTNAFRLYDHDIPAYPFRIDRYHDYVVIYEQGLDSAPDDLRLKHKTEINTALNELGFGPDKQIFKQRFRQTESQKYQKLENAPSPYVATPTSLKTQVFEGEMAFLVNLTDYIDTGLFLDHRPLRKELTKICHGLRVLNLFCYTSSLGVAAAKGGAVWVENRDLSVTYLKWSQENFKLNNLDLKKCDFVQTDILGWLENLPATPNETFDLILLDPPSFSHSKRMTDVLDLQEDHSQLIFSCTRLLSDKGKILFSTNKKKFKLAQELQEKLLLKETSHWTVAKDCRPQTHKSWEITLRK
jgi:23S rRNA G2069 N7-methylase RlmK/C1962 C5-methylase RlmI